MGFGGKGFCEKIRRIKAFGDTVYDNIVLLNNDKNML